MGVLLILLSFFALIVLLVGLIKPSWVKMNSRKKSSAIYGATFVALLIIGTILTPASDKKQDVAIIDTSKTQASSTPVVVEKTVPVTQIVETPKPKTREQLITQIIEASLGATTNMSKPRVVSAELTNYKASELISYGYKSTDTVQSVLVKVNASENVTSNLQKATLNKGASQIFKDIFASFPQIGDIIIWERLPVVDKYGNSSDDTAIVYAMGRPLYEKINWSNFSYSNLPSLLKSEARTDDRNSYYEAIKF